jgi:hypothetical protein
MSTESIIGNYANIHADRRAINLSFSLPVMEVMNFWSRCGLIANFGSSYMAVANPSRKNIANSLSFILNELIENAVKYAAPRDSVIDLSILQQDRFVIIEITNPIEPAQEAQLREMATNLIDADYVNSRYIDLLTASGKSSEKSGIGLLTIINYYRTELSFRIGGPRSAYAIQARINLEEL